MGGYELRLDGHVSSGLNICSVMLQSLQDMTSRSIKLCLASPEDACKLAWKPLKETFF